MMSKFILIPKKSALLFFFFLLFLFGGLFPVEAADPQGRIYSIDDYSVAGSAWDPDCPSEPVEVHVYHGEPAGVVCLAKSVCPDGWPGICFDQQAGRETGFWCAYRHPVNASSVPNDINVAVINKCGNNDLPHVWLDKSQAITQVIYDREINNIFVDKPAYKIGISKRFGASIVELYNKRIDPTVNLVQSDPGASYQVAIFGAPDRPVSSYPNCFGVNDLLYNPTQAGSHCGHPNGSEIRKCWADGIEKSCSSLPNTFTGRQLKFDVHFRNFYYTMNPTGSYPYRDFDDVYGIITYTFENDYVQVDWDIWKTSATKWGSNWQQLPVAFLLQLTKFNYKKDGKILSGGDPYKTLWMDIIEVDNDLDGRWVTISGSAEGIRKTAAPDDFLTLAFYNPPINNRCPPRRIQMNFLPNEEELAVQNALYFEAEINHNMKARTLIFPYKYNETLPGKSKNLGELVDTYASKGGFMPEWECNIPPTPTATPTTTPTLTPTPRPTNTPTPTPKPGDITGDGKIDGADYAVLMANFGKTGNRSQGDLTGDGKIDEADYAVLMANFGK